MNDPPQEKSGEEFEACKADTRRKRENETRGESCAGLVQNSDALIRSYWNQSRGIRSQLPSPAPSSSSISIGEAPLKRTTSWSFDEKLRMQSLYKVMVFVSKTYPVVLYLRDVDKLL